MTELNTIDYWMKDKVPGSVKLTNKGYSIREYFIPYFRAKTVRSDEEGKWCGVCDEGLVQSFWSSDNQWSLYQEPKKMVKRWKWASKGSSSKWVESAGFYTDEEAKKWLEDAIKILYTETEFPE